VGQSLKWTFQTDGSDRITSPFLYEPEHFVSVHRSLAKGKKNQPVEEALGFSAATEKEMMSMAEHKEEATMDKISDKFHGEDSWSSSDLDDKKKTKRSAAAATDIKPKAFPSGAAARFRDLPEVLRRQLGGVDERAGHGFLIAVALAPPSGLSERPVVRYLLIPLAGEVISPVERNTGHGDDVCDATRYYANISLLQVQSFTPP
jgi:hypothetical protein